MLVPAYGVSSIDARPVEPAVLSPPLAVDPAPGTCVPHPVKLRGLLASPPPPAAAKRAVKPSLILSPTPIPIPAIPTAPLAAFSAAFEDSIQLRPSDNALSQAGEVIPPPPFDPLGAGVGVNVPVLLALTVEELVERARKDGNGAFCCGTTGSCSGKVEVIVDSTYLSDMVQGRSAPSTAAVNRCEHQCYCIGLHCYHQVDDDDSTVPTPAASCSAARNSIAAAGAIFLLQLQELLRVVKLSCPGGYSDKVLHRCRHCHPLLILSTTCANHLQTVKMASISAGTRNLKFMQRGTQLPVSSTLSAPSRSTTSTTPATTPAQATTSAEKSTSATQEEEEQWTLPSRQRSSAKGKGKTTGDRSTTRHSTHPRVVVTSESSYLAFVGPSASASNQEGSSSDDDMDGSNAMANGRLTFGTLPSKQTVSINLYPRNSSPPCLSLTNPHAAGYLNRRQPRENVTRQSHNYCFRPLRRLFSFQRGIIIVT